MRYSRRILLQIAFMTCFLVADQVTKAIFGGFGERGSHMVGGFLSLQPSLNSGLAFSVPLWSWAALLINLGVLIALIWYWVSRLALPESWWLAVAIGGAFGNLVDRLFLGGVRDWFVINWGFSLSSINLADVCVIVGALGWIWAHGKRMKMAQELKEAGNSDIL